LKIRRLQSIYLSPLMQNGQVAPQRKQTLLYGVQACEGRPALRPDPTPVWEMRSFRSSPLAKLMARTAETMSRPLAGWLAPSPSQQRFRSPEANPACWLLRHDLRLPIERSASPSPNPCSQPERYPAHSLRTKVIDDPVLLPLPLPSVLPCSMPSRLPRPGSAPTHSKRIPSLRRRAVACPQPRSQRAGSSPTKEARSRCSCTTEFGRRRATPCRRRYLPR
jgi:hypothetical protein